MTTSEKKIYNYTAYVNDETGKVQYAVDRNASNPTTLYPYTASRRGGWDNAAGDYTPEALRRKIKDGTAIFS